MIELFNPFESHLHHETHTNKIFMPFIIYTLVMHMHYPHLNFFIPHDEHMHKAPTRKCFKNDKTFIINTISKVFPCRALSL